MVASCPVRLVMFQFSALPPLSLYIHVPWCVRKCPYCDFNSHGLQGEVPENDYVDALLRDLEVELPGAWGRTVRTVFIGGGTPSLFSPEAIARLLSGVRARIALEPGAEITLEANPGTVELARFCGYRDAGVNRLSIGVQSFAPEKLAALGRIHGRDEALAAADAARAAGFDNLNLDLMFGLPGQSLAEAAADIETAIAQNPTHLSVYQLTIEPNTPFHAHPPARLPDDDGLWDMQQEIQHALAAHGFRQYEVSAYARPGRECAHNLNYWCFGDYLGIGAGAHAKITDAAGIVRRRRVKHPRDFLAAAGGAGAIAGEQRLTRRDAAAEFMLNALRLKEGFASPLFSERTGLPLNDVLPTLAQAEARGLLEHDARAVRASERGYRFLNDLVAMFL
jgi:putative oxygen-independent coproporphyrinogen III oxidase